MSSRMLFARSVALALAAVVLASPTSNAIGTAGRVDWATNYVVHRQDPDGKFPSSFGSAHASTADAVLALVASGQGGEQVEAAMDWLEVNVGGADNLGKRAKVVMAAVAAGRDPRDFGGTDLVQAIEGTLGGDAVYDSSPFSQVYDQALALLALAAADAPVTRAPVMWLAEAQCPDGGWQFDQPRQPGENRRCKNTDAGAEDFTETDTNTTGLVLQALAAVPRSVPLGRNPFVWLRDRRDPIKRGWGFDRAFSLTDSASTAIVIQAYAAQGRKLPKGAQRSLRRLQRYCNAPKGGGFSRGWEKTEKGYRRASGQDMGNTVAAIPGLLKEPLPIEPKPFLERMPRALPCDSAS